jgi:NADH-quinone oxidoreductase subunit G
MLSAYSQQGFKGAAKGVITMNLEPALDCGDAGAALAGAEFVVGLTSFASAIVDVADVMLPIAPFTETSGSFISMEGRLQTFTAAVKPLAETRPGWKVLRVLGTQAGFQGFEFDTSDAIRSAAIGDDSQIAARLSNGSDLPLKTPAGSGAALERVADVPVYFSDTVVRRAPALQKTSDARTPTARLNAKTLNALGLEDNAQVRVLAASGHADLKVKVDNTLPDCAVRIAAAHATTAALGDKDAVTLERLA